MGRIQIEAPLVLLLFVVWLATWVPRLRGPIDLRWDAAVYYTLGTALAEGKGYRLLNEPGEIAGNQYPPGLPLIVAAHQRMLGTGDPVLVGVALRGFYVVASALYIFSVYLLLRSSFPPLTAFLGGIICTLSLPVVWLSDRLYSDIPFLLATTWFMLLCRGSTPMHRFGAGTAAAVAFALRTVGAALLVAWIAEAALTRTWRRVVLRLSLTLILLGGWQGYVWWVERSAGYQTPAYPYQRAPYLLYNVSYTTNASLKRPFFPEQGRASTGDLIGRFASNVVSVPASIGEALSTSSENWSRYLEDLRGVPIAGLVARWRVIRAVLTVIGLVTLAGAWFFLRRTDVTAPAVALTYVLGVCAMTFSQEFARYLIGIQPILVLFLFTMLFKARLPAAAGRIRYPLLAAVLVPICAGEVAALREAYTAGLSRVTHRHWHGRDVTYRMFWYADTFRGFDAAAEWVGQHAAPTEVIASSQPHWVYLRTGRLSVMPPFERDPATQQALLDSVPVTFVIVDSDGFSATREYSLPALLNERRWRRAYHSADGSTEVYKRLSDRDRSERQ